MVVDDKFAKMEAAAEEDMEQHEAGRPAVQKLKMLAEVDDFLAQVCLCLCFIWVPTVGSHGWTALHAMARDIWGIWRNGESEGIHCHRRKNQGKHAANI